MTILINWDDVINVAKVIEDELTAIPILQQNDIMLQAAVYTNVHLKPFCGGFIKFFGLDAHNVYVKAMQQYRAAHLGTNINIEPAGEGGITGETIGSISSSNNQSVNNPKADEGFLETIYGRTFYDYFESYKKALAEIAKTSVGTTGLFSGGKIIGLPVVITTC